MQGASQARSDRLSITTRAPAGCVETKTSTAEADGGALLSSCAAARPGSLAACFAFVCSCVGLANAGTVAPAVFPAVWVFAGELETTGGGEGSGRELLLEKNRRSPTMASAGTMSRARLRQRPSVNVS